MPGLATEWMLKGGPKGAGPKVWAGVSVTKPTGARIRTLKQVRAAICFVSLEPILKPIDVTGWFTHIPAN